MKLFDNINEHITKLTFEKIMVYIFLYIFFILVIYLSFFQGKPNYDSIDAQQIKCDKVIGEIVKNVEVGQTFKSNKNNLDAISLKLATYARNNDKDIIFGIREKNKAKDIYTCKFNAKVVQNNALKTFKFKPISNSKNKEYYIYLKSDDSKAGNAITVWYNDSNLYNDGEALLNNKKIKGDLIFQVHNYDQSIGNNKFFKFFLVNILLVIFISINGYVFARINYNLEKSFLFIGILFGILFLLIMPPFQIPDEQAHFCRAYEVSDGHMVSLTNGTALGDYLPMSIINTFGNFANKYNATDIKSFSQNINYINKNLKMSLNRKDTKIYNFTNTALYSPIPYIPQSLGMLTGKAFNTSPLLMMYLGRLVNLLTWIILMFFTLKILPFGKKLFFLLMLTPMSMHQAASLSADALTNGLSFLFIALCLNLSKNVDIKIRKKDIILLIGLSVLIALCKISYLPLILLYFIIPNKKFKNKKVYYILFCIICFVCVSSNILWTKNITSDLKVILNPIASQKEQIHFVITHPFKYAIILLKTISTNGKLYITCCIGASLGWLNINIPDSIIFSYCFILLFIILIDNDDLEQCINYKVKAIFSATILGTFVMIASSLYATWTAYMAPIVEGVQGRYFIPITPLVVFLFYNKKIKNDFKNLNKLICFYSAWCLSYTIIFIISTYYV